jgi:GT2 family glycosyltransferase
MTLLDSLQERHRGKVAEWTTSGDAAEQLLASVVVVTYRVDERAFRRTIEALDQQTEPRFEVIIVDNGTEWETGSVVDGRRGKTTYVRLDDNHGVTTARNIGASLAASELLVFLDDDAVPAPDFVEEHVAVHRERDIVAARGRVVPLSGKIYNLLETHYDLGEATVPYFINTEGNASIDRETFLQVGGFDEDLEGRAGHEGIELSQRLVDSGVARDEIVYYPNAVIEHDYAESFVDYLRKETRFRRLQRRNREAENDPNQAAFVASYEDRGMQCLGLSEYVGLLLIEVLIGLFVRWDRLVHRLRRTRQRS